MSNRIMSLSAATALAIAALIPAAAFADQTNGVYANKGVYAMSVESRGRATNPVEIRRQGGFLTPASVRWTDTPAEAASQASKGVNAMFFETRGRATSSADIRRQGGFLTAGAAAWQTVPATDAADVTGSIQGAGTVGALVRETRGLATNPADVRHQGGRLTPGAVRWVSAPAD